MKLLDRLFGRKAAQLTYDQVADLIDGANGGQVAGVTVTEKTALQVATVLACVKVIADGCATPSLGVFRKLDDGRRQRAENIPEYRLLSRRPNEWQTSFEWRRQMTLHAALTGAGLSIKVRGDNRRVRELIPVQPGRWDVRKISRYEVRYRCWDEFGLIGEFAPDDVFVLNGVQWDWVCSMNAVVLARSAVGLAIATERSQSAMHANGLRPSGAYAVEGTLSKSQYDDLSAYLKNKSGPDRAGTPLILDRNAKWLNTAMTGVDAQHIETRRLQIEEMCRAYGVFPILVGHSDKSATFASSEAFFAAHLKHTLAPWHQAWTQRIDEMLLDGSGPLYAEFDTRYLTAGAMKDRALWARTMAEMGIYTRNEIRDEEGKDPLPGLDDPLTPMNMVQGDQSEDDAKKARLESIERKLITLADRQHPAPQTTIEVRTDRIEKALENALKAMTTNYAMHLKGVAADMPITFSPVFSPVFSPLFQPTVQAPEVTFEATVPPATVVVNGPKRSAQKVERDADGEITQTTTVFEYQ